LRTDGAGREHKDNKCDQPWRGFDPSNHEGEAKARGDGKLVKPALAAIGHEESSDTGIDGSQVGGFGARHRARDEVSRRAICGYALNALWVGCQTLGMTNHALVFRKLHDAW
jgi:hypothetical protein